MRLKRLTPNKPRHGLGEYGKQRQRAPLNAGEHMPQRIETGYDDRKGYGDSPERRNGEHKGKLPGGDTRRREGAEGNSKGSPPPGVKNQKAVRGNPDSHMGDAGRGGSGRHGKGDNFKGKATPMTEEPSHSWFERLGSD